MSSSCYFFTPAEAWAYKVRAVLVALFGEEIRFDGTDWRDYSAHNVHTLHFEGSDSIRGPQQPNFMSSLIPTVVKHPESIDEVDRWMNWMADTLESRIRLLQRGVLDLNYARSYKEFKERFAPRIFEDNTVYGISYIGWNSVDSHTMFGRPVAGIEVRDILRPHPTAIWRVGYGIENDMAENGIKKFGLLINPNYCASSAEHYHGWSLDDC